MKKVLVALLMVLGLLVPLFVLPVPAHAATIGGRLFGTGGDITVQILPSTAGYTSSLYLYSPRVEFIGTNREAGKVVTLTGIADGEELIFGILVHDTGWEYRMGPGSRNPDGIAHAGVTEVGERVFDVGFEDVFGGGDQDYDDNVFRFSGALAPEPPPVDNVPPVTEHIAMPEANANGWANQSVHVGLTATDTAQEGAEVSGVEQIFASVGGMPQSCLAGAACGFSLSGSGIYTVAYYARDNAGNTEEEHQFTVSIDMEGPMIVYTATPADASPAGWMNSPVVLTFTCTDSLSGVDVCPGDVTLTEGAPSATVIATDRADNQSSLTVARQIDQTAPQIAGAPDRAPDSAGWYNAPVTVSFVCSDGLSGIAACAGPAVLTEGADQSVTGTAVDNAGNTATATVGPLSVDMTAPVVMFAGNAGTYAVDELINITCASFDTLSGVASDTCAPISAAGWELGAGSHSFTASATDVAGNTGSATVSFTVAVTKASLCRLVQAWSSKDGVAHSLCVKLENAQTIDPFLHELAAQSGKAFTAEEAAMLMQLAGQL